MHLEYSWQPCEQPPTYPTKRDRWAGGKISKNCPVRRNKIITEWHVIWSWEFPAHNPWPPQTSGLGEKLLARIVLSLPSCNLLKLLFATFKVRSVKVLCIEKTELFSVLSKHQWVVALWYFWVTLFFCKFCY